MRRRAAAPARRAKGPDRRIKPTYYRRTRARRVQLIASPVARPTHSRRPAMWLVLGLAAILFLAPAAIGVAILVAPDSLGAMDTDSLGAPGALLRLAGWFKWPLWTVLVLGLGVVEATRTRRQAEAPS